MSPCISAGISCNALHLSLIYACCTTSTSSLLAHHTSLPTSRHCGSSFFGSPVITSPCELNAEQKFLSPDMPRAPHGLPKTPRGDVLAGRGPPSGSLDVYVHAMPPSDTTPTRRVVFEPRTGDLCTLRFGNDNCQLELLARRGTIRSPSGRVSP